MPLDKPGAKEIPIIPPIEENLQVFLNLKANAMHGLEKEIKKRMFMKMTMKSKISKWKWRRTAENTPSCLRKGSSR